MLRIKWERPTMFEWCEARWGFWLWWKGVDDFGLRILGLSIGIER